MPAANISIQIQIDQDSEERMKPKKNWRGKNRSDGKSLSRKFCDLNTYKNFDKFKVNIFRTCFLFLL